MLYLEAYKLIISRLSACKVAKILSEQAIRSYIGYIICFLIK